jgi:CYTH domain-containing protein/predicted ATPase
MSELPKVVVFTGGPCGGKSTVLPMAKQWLENHGCIVGILPEAATEVIQAGFSPMSSLWTRPQDFQEHLLRYQIEREDRYFRMLEGFSHNIPRVLLCDRGTLDSMAYMGRERYLEMLAHMWIKLPDLRDRYTSVIHMMSTARGAPDFYTLANNAARSETPEQAAEIDERIEQAWLGQPHFHMIDNSTNFTDKVRRVFSALARTLHVPEPLEIEKKFLVFTWHMPKKYVSVDITQDYLTPTEEEPERRVRKRVLDGAASYFYTSKRQTNRPGVRVEKERQINLGEYEKLLKECIPTAKTIRKNRLCFLYEGKHLELDIFLDIKYRDGPLTLLEIELGDENETVKLPEGWGVRDVTGYVEYSNAHLAGVK